MPDRADFPRSRVVRQVPSANTVPEVRVREALHRLGVRFRLDQPIVLERGRVVRPDLTFRGLKVAVFVDGCFWHSCSAHCRTPSSNREYWTNKISGNARRDRATTERLETSGWTVVRVWEHEDPELAALRIQEAMSGARARGRPSSATKGTNPALAPSDGQVGSQLERLPAEVVNAR